MPILLLFIQRTLTFDCHETQLQCAYLSIFNAKRITVLKCSLKQVPGVWHTFGHVLPPVH